MKVWLKRRATDIAGVVLILASGLVGWLPGPLGLPLFFGGLSLLAINHDWAKRVLFKFKTEGGRVSGLVFPSDKRGQIIFLLIGVLILSGGLYLLLNYRHGVLISFGISFSLLGLILWIGNLKNLIRRN